MVLLKLFFRLKSDEDDVRGEDIERRLVELEQKEQKSSICSVL